jgi:hypothetical protein
MNRTLCGLAVLAIGVGSWACKGDPQGDLRTDPDKVIASPSSMFVRQGEPELVLIEVVDLQGNELAASDFTLTSNNAGVVVVEDTTFNLVFDANGDGVRPDPWTRARYEVTGNDFVSTTLTATALGRTLEIPIRVVPATALAFGISNLTPPLGDTVTFTAAPNTLFTDSSVVSFPGDVSPICNCGPEVVSVDPTGATMQVLLGPNMNGPATVTNVQVGFDPSLVFTVNSADVVVNPVITDLGNPFNTNAPTLGQILTMTAPAGFVFQTSTTVVFPNSPAPVVSGPGLGLSPDSTQLSMLVPPNMDTLATVTNVIHERLPTYPLTLFTTTNVTTPVIVSFPVTYSPATPAVGDVVRLTAGPGFSFDPTVTGTAITLPGATAGGFFFIGADPGGTWIDIRPPVSYTGAPVVDLVIATAAPQFLLSLPAGTDLVTPAGLAGTDDPATAPTLPIPPSGSSVTFYDGGPFNGTVFGPDRIYKFTLTATTSFTITFDWSNGADPDLLFVDAAITGFQCGFSAATGAQPELADCQNLPAGDYLMVVNLFGGAVPGLLELVITTQ